MITNEQIIILVLAIVVIALLIWVLQLEKRYRKVFRGRSARDFEESIFSVIDEIKDLQKSKSNIEVDIEDIERRLRRSIQGIGTIRFKPFKDSGGNQSFAISLINEKGDGIVLSSLYARERVSVFAKPIKSHKSEYDLTREEKEALKEARLDN